MSTFLIIVINLIYLYMGLDQYLEGKVYVGNKYRKGKDKVEVSFPKAESKNVTFKIKGNRKKYNDKLSEIVFEAGCWRKANQIHNWFVKNVQDGDDDCKAHYVTREQLQELLDIVNRVLGASKLVNGKVANGYSYDGKGNKVGNMVDGKYIEDPTLAKELLPSTDGFFFGGTDYDENYYQDLVDTKNILEPILEDKDDDAEYYYRASW